MSQIERRKLKRYVQRVEADFESGRMSGRGRVRNLSKAGLFIRSDQLPEPGLPISITIETTSGEKIELKGTVRWTTAQLPNARSVPAGFGVSLDRECTAYRELFEAILLPS